MDQTQHNATVVRRLYEEVMNRRNIALLDTLVVPNPVVHIQSLPQPIQGAEPFKQSLMRQWQSTPDHQYTVLALIARGDRVAVQLKANMTNTQPVGNWPASGRQVESHEICFYRLANGRIEEVWTLIDEYSFMSQVSPTAFPVGRW